MQGLRIFLSTHQNTKMIENICRTFISGMIRTIRIHTTRESRLSVIKVRRIDFGLFGIFESSYRKFQNDYLERHALTRTLTENDIGVIKLSGKYDNRLKTETAKTQPEGSEIEQKKGEFLLKATPVTLEKLLVKRNNKQLLLLM